MKIISNGYYLEPYFKKFFIINNGKAEEIEASSIASYYFSKNIYDETIKCEEHYPVFILNDIKKVSSNHIESNIKKDITFYCGESVYFSSKLVKEINTTEKRTEYHKGDVAISYNKEIIFTDNIVRVKESETFFAKPTDQVAQQYGRESVEEIGAHIESLRTKYSFFNENEKLKQIRAKHIEILESKIKEGYKYIVSYYQAKEKYTNSLLFNGFVVKHEKSAEYIKAEKLSKELKEKYNIDIFATTLMEVLQDYKITKRRKQGAQNDKRVKK